jgi:hypothetical protein
MIKNKLFLISIIIFIFISNAMINSKDKSSAKTYNPPINDPEIFVDIFKENKSIGGTTIFADFHISKTTKILEVNMNGEIIWEYILPANQKRYTNPGFDVEYLPNNNILYTLPGNGVYEVNRNGDIVWQYKTKKISHDADRLSNGNTIFCFGNNDTINDPQIQEIDKQGKIIWQWYAKKYFNKEPYKNISSQGWTHTNSVVRLNNGNTLISLRNFNLIIEVNQNGNIVWEFNIKAFGRNPHEPKILNNDNLIFACRVRKWDPIIEIDRKKKEPVWNFDTKDFDLIRGVQPLPNGNYLLTGRNKIIEITKDKELVWRLQMKNILKEERPSSPKDTPQFYIYKAERKLK